MCVGSSAPRFRALGLSALAALRRRTGQARCDRIMPEHQEALLQPTLYPATKF